VNWFAHVFRRPTRFVLEQSNAANAFGRAKIEPVVSSFGNADQVSRFDGDAEHGCRLRIDMKYARAFNGKTHFIFGVQVLFVE